MPAKQKIMMISTHGYVSAQAEFGKPDTGGQVVYVLELSKCLARLGYRVDIFTRRFENQPQIESVADRVRIVRLPCGGKSFIPKEALHRHIPEWVKRASEYIASHKARYWFINSHYWDGGLAGQALANQFDIPHLHTPHSIGAWKRDNMEGDPRELDQKYNFTVRIREEKIIYDECDALIATTAQQRDILEGKNYDVPSEKIHVVPPGYDDTRFFPVSLASKAAIKQQMGLDGPLVLSLGRIARNKGYDLLLRAMPGVVRRIPDVRLLLAIGSTAPTSSEQDQIQELRTLAETLEIQDRVIFHDYIPDDKLPDYYRLADVFALSSRYEPFGMTAIEAMACGTPTVISTQGGLWRLIMRGVDAVYADPFDSEEFGMAVYSILKYSRYRNQLVKYGSQKVRTHFTWMGVAQQVVSLLQHLVLKGGRFNTLGRDEETPWKKEKTFLSAT